MTQHQRNKKNKGVNKSLSLFDNSKKLKIANERDFCIKQELQCSLVSMLENRQVIGDSKNTLLATTIIQTFLYSNRLSKPAVKIINLLETQDFLSLM